MSPGERSTLPRQSRSASTQRVARPDAKRRANQAGTPRTSAQPLTASWQPAPGRPPGRRSGEQAPRRRRPPLLRSSALLAYAASTLIALTALILIDTVRENGIGAPASGDQVESLQGPGTGAPGELSATPEATELPPVPVDLNLPTAELPNGGAYTEVGAGRWHVLPGVGQKVGTAGKLHTYTVEVEDGIDPASFGGDEAFARLVDETLADPRGWAGTGGVTVQRVDASVANPSFRISLTTPGTVHRPDKCGFAIRYESSCFHRADRRVMINLARWVRGAVAFGGDMGTYRQYAINHEVGHAFNNGHVGCATEGGLAPVMMQQTFGVANNIVAELNTAARYRDPVVADGKTCKYNAWPNPQAKPGG
jgi:hypothetical protein